MYVYPSNDLEVADSLQNTLGSFWDVLYGDRETVNSYCVAKGEVELQSVQDLGEAAAACGHDACPVYRRVRWLPFTVRRSQVTVVDGGYQVQAPPSLAKANVVSSHITNPSVVWVYGVDYALAGGTFTFYQDPFQVDFAQNTVYNQDGTRLDDEITFWLFHADTDVDRLYERLGQVFGLRMTSSEGYKRLLNAAWYALVRGTTRGDIEDAMSALTGIPLVRNESEVVSYVTYDKDDLLVITDLAVYRFPAAAKAVVVPGQALGKGQAMTDVLRLYDMSLGQAPPVQSLSLGPGLLAPSIPDRVIFTNVDVPLEVTTAPDGHTVARFALEGDVASVDQFWALTDQKGVASGTTLARRMDTRANKVGEPTANNLPQTVNPLRFLSQHVLRYNAVLALLRPSAFGPDAVGLEHFRTVRRMMSPHQAVIPVEVTAAGDGITMDGLA
jgi:hypothetical protein